MALKTFFKTDYRGIARLLADFTDLRKDLGLNKAPYNSAPCYATGRLLKKGEAVGLLYRATASATRSPTAAVDGTGLESRHASRYFFKRAGRKPTSRLWIKLAVTCDTRSHFFAGATVATGLPNGSRSPGAWSQASLAVTGGRTLADPAFDASAVAAFQ